MAAKVDETNRVFFKIPSPQIKLGMRFSAPVFFDDGKNMFLAEGKSAKKYHIAALARWKIPFVLTYGHQIDENSSFDDDEDFSYAELEELEAADE